MQLMVNGRRTDNSMNEHYCLLQRTFSPSTKMTANVALSRYNVDPALHFKHLKQ